MLIISAVNIIFGTASWYFIVIAVIWCTVLQFAIDGTLAFLINKMPNAWFGADNVLYNVSEAEKSSVSLNVKGCKCISCVIRS